MLCSGEGMAAIPVIKRCVHCRPDLSILMTTTTFSALYDSASIAFPLFCELY